MTKEIIRRIIEELKKQISNLESQKKKLLNFEELVALSKEEIINRLKDYEINNLSELITYIENYQSLLKIAQYVSNTLKNSENAIKNCLDKNNSSIESKNKECQEKITKLYE